MTDLTSEDFKRYRRTQIAEMADWHEGFDMERVSVSAPDAEAGSPKTGDKIARNPANHDDRWLVAAEYFAANFEPEAREPVDHLSDRLDEIRARADAEFRDPQDWRLAYRADVTYLLAALASSQEPARVEASTSLRLAALLREHDDKAARQEFVPAILDLYHDAQRAAGADSFFPESAEAFDEVFAFTLRWVLAEESEASVSPPEADYCETCDDDGWLPNMEPESEDSPKWVLCQECNADAHLQLPFSFVAAPPVNESEA